MVLNPHKKTPLTIGKRRKCRKSSKQCGMLQGYGRMMLTDQHPATELLLTSRLFLSSLFSLVLSLPHFFFFQAGYIVLTLDQPPWFECIHPFSKVNNLTQNVQYVFGIFISSRVSWISSVWSVGIFSSSVITDHGKQYFVYGVEYDQTLICSTPWWGKGTTVTFIYNVFAN